MIGFRLTETVEFIGQDEKRVMSLENLEKYWEASAYRLLIVISLLLLRVIVSQVQTFAIKAKYEPAYGRQYADILNLAHPIAILALMMLLASLIDLIFLNAQRTRISREIFMVKVMLSMVAIVYSLLPLQTAVHVIVTAPVTVQR